MPMTIECNTDDLEILLEGAKETGDCMLILHTTDNETVCLRARQTKKPGRPRKVQTAGAGLIPPQPQAENRLEASGNNASVIPTLIGGAGA